MFATSKMGNEQTTKVALHLPFNVQLLSMAGADPRGRPLTLTPSPREWVSMVASEFACLADNCQ